MRDKRIRTILPPLLLLGALAAGCDESPPGTTGSGASSANGGGGSAADGGGGSAPAIPVVINEMQAQYEDWVELMNTGDEPFDLSDYAVADSQGDGTPKIDAAARFPSGTTLGAGELLLLVLEQDAVSGVGPHDVCLTTGGPSTCYYGTWGISASKGEVLHLLAPDDTLVGEAEYPMNGAPVGSSYGRLPDGTGDFQLTAQTPGEPNEAP